MGILAQILGSGDVVSKGLDLIDSFHTSDVEAIESKSRARTDLLAAYHPFKRAQRYLALLFGFTFVGSYLMILILFFMGRDISAAQEIVSTFKIDFICLTIVAFYFGGGAFSGLHSKKEKK